MKRFRNSISLVLRIHLCGLAALSLLRLIQFTLQHDYIGPTATGQGWLQSIAFIRGLWFDNVIACYISLLPLVAVFIASLFNYGGRRLLTPIVHFMQTLFSITLIISAANIPYFEYFSKNINSSVFNWFEYGFTTLGMVFGEASYYPPLLLMIGFIVLFVWCTNKIKRNTIEKNGKIEPCPIHWQNRLSVTCVGAVLIALCIFGIRGRRGYNPIKVSAAYYCEDPFLNQLGVNPAFNLLTSALDEARPENRFLHLLDEQAAINQAQRYLGRKGIEGISPIAGKVISNDTLSSRRPNIVFILMESMSANLMQTFGQEQCLTPFLDSLFSQSIGFYNMYSAGIHTNHGLYASLYSFPAIMKRNLMKSSVIPTYTGLPTILKDHGYNTMFFMTHESQYDNMNAFFRTNGYNEIYAQENYPKDKVVNSFGVSDDFLYSYALNVMNEKSKDDQPFFATLLSISNHPPYIIPSDFHPKSLEKEWQIVEYSDWAIKQFFAQASQQPWFSNTIFVLEGDHGKRVGTDDSEMPQSFNHIPLFIYSPMLQAQGREDWATQMDIQPTLLGLLGIDYTQNNFGIDLLRESRPCTFYTADNRIGARNQDHLYVYSPETQQEFFYLVSQQGKQAVATQNSDSTFAMLKDYAFSMLQTAEYMVKNGMTRN